MSGAGGPNLGVGFAELTNRYAEEYSSKWWACKRCPKPDYFVKYWPNEPPRLTVECNINRYAPHAASNNCPRFEEAPDIAEFWEGEDSPHFLRLIAEHLAAHPTPEVDARAILTTQHQVPWS